VQVHHCDDLKAAGFDLMISHAVGKLLQELAAIFFV
jgi:hypothetical protein